MTDKKIWTAMIREMLTDALLQTKITHRRTTGWHSAIINATRNADRISLANDADSMRLTLSVVIELLRDSLDVVKNLESEENS